MKQKNQLNKNKIMKYCEINFIVEIHNKNII